MLKTCEQMVLREIMKEGALTLEGQRKRGIDPVGKNLVIEDEVFHLGI